MKLTNLIYGERPAVFTQDDKKIRHLRLFFDFIFLAAFALCLPAGAIGQYNSILSVLLLMCAMVSFLDENFYIYSALFMYMRYRMLIGDEPAFRIYSYLVVIRFLIDLSKTKFRVTYLPAIFVFAMHCAFATVGVAGFRTSLNVLVDVVLVYIILLKVLEDSTLLRKFMFAFILGGVLSGVYGWLNSNVAVDINVAGAGAQTVNRNFGALGDPNFAGLLYSLCILVSLTLKNIPVWLRCLFTGFFLVLILQTASLSAIITLVVLSTFLIILRYKSKSFFILLFGFVAVTLVVGFLLSIPAFRQIDAVQGLIIRITEKLSYIPRGRWDLLTTDRWDIWSQALRIFMAKPIWGQLIGGNVITVMATEEAVSFACHNSYIQSLLNFGVLGTVLIYIPFISAFLYRLTQHFVKKNRYEDEDIKVIQLVFMFGFLFFGMTVDFFIDWTYMVLYFI